MLIVDQPQVRYSHRSLSALCAAGGMLIICGEDHLPSAMLVPLSSHNHLVERFHMQLNISAPLKKQLWKQLVIAKIRAQASAVCFDDDGAKRVDAYAGEVRSGDPTNIEAQAARAYWSVWRPIPTFRRDGGSRSGLNGMLDYGYAIVRAAVARQCIVHGLHPLIGIHHNSRSNAFCLADDLVEPLRPLVDRIVRDVWMDGTKTLDPLAKQRLIGVMHTTVRTGDRVGPLVTALSPYISSFVNSHESNSAVLTIPTFVNDDEDL